VVLAQLHWRCGYRRITALVRRRGGWLIRPR
jgi:hypothetical protein